MDDKKKIFYYVNVLPNQGGQWYYAINQLDYLKKELKNKYNIKVFVSNKKVQNALRENEINSELINISLLEKIILKFDKSIPFLNKIFNIQSKFEKKLLSMNCSLLYIPHLFFLNCLIKKIPTVVSILDLCHLDYPYLEEFSDNNDISQREFYLNNYTNKTFLIIAESEDTKKKLIEKYKIENEKILIKYFDISKNLEIKKSEEIDILKNKRFIFYPSNFLSHKNHKLIIDAQDYLLKKDFIYVFCGNDRGYLDKLKLMIKKKNLSNYFLIFKSLDLAKMNYLYKNCDAIIYPSLFGPANIPLFEAWYLRKPILYPKQFNNFSKNGAISFDNTDPKSLAESINQIKESDKNKKIIEDGYKNYLNYRNLDQKFIRDFIIKLNNI